MLLQLLVGAAPPVNWRLCAAAGRSAQPRQGTNTMEHNIKVQQVCACCARVPSQLSALCLLWWHNNHTMRTECTSVQTNQTERPTPRTRPTRLQPLHVLSLGRASGGSVQRRPTTTQHTGLYQKRHKSEHSCQITNIYIVGTPCQNTRRCRAPCNRADILYCRCKPQNAMQDRQRRGACCAAALHATHLRAARTGGQTMNARWRDRCASG